MARKEVLVQLDDDLVSDLDRISTELGISRSELLRRAARSAVQVEDWARADRDLVEAYRRLPPDAGLSGTLSRLASETVPEW